MLKYTLEKWKVMECRVQSSRIMCKQSLYIIIRSGLRAVMVNISKSQGKNLSPGRQNALYKSSKIQHMFLLDLLCSDYLLRE